MHEPLQLLLTLLLGALVVTVAGAIGRHLMAPHRRAARELRAALGGRADAVIAGLHGAAVAVRSEDHRIALRRGGSHAVEAFAFAELAGAELVADGQVLARAWRGEARRALDRTPEDPQRLELRLTFDRAGAAEIALVTWDAGERPPSERAAAIEATRRGFSQLDAALRAPRRPPPGDRRDEMEDR